MTLTDAIKSVSARKARAYLYAAYYDLDNSQERACFHQGRADAYEYVENLLEVLKADIEGEREELSLVLRTGWKQDGITIHDEDSGRESGASTSD